MKTEFLILIPDSESFCSTTKAFTDFLKVDSLISISGNKINFRKTPKGKDQVTAKFRITTDKVKSNSERYFTLTLECEQHAQIDEFSELSDRIKSIVERISPTATSVNTLWDGVGRIYAEKAYPIINETENLMRRLIAKFMLITVGMNWSKDAIHPELFKKIEKFEDEDPYLNDLHKLDFIHLSQVLFEKKRDITLEELDRILPKTTFNENDKEKILKYIPRSNWEKYFAALVDEKDHNLEKKWELLYKLRNKVAHNRNVKKSEFEKIKGLASDIKEVINKAATKLGEIDLNDEDRELIKYSYRSGSASALGYIAEKAVAENYIKLGYSVIPAPNSAYYHRFDFLAEKDGKTIAVIVKSLLTKVADIIIRNTINYLNESHEKQSDDIAPYDIHFVCVLRDNNFKTSLEPLFNNIFETLQTVSQEIEVHIGRLDDENNYVPL